MLGKMEMVSRLEAMANSKGWAGYSKHLVVSQEMTHPFPWTICLTDQIVISMQLLNIQISNTLKFLMIFFP